MKRNDAEEGTHRSEKIVIMIRYTVILFRRTG
jgi:hypothetical protein